MKTSDSSHNYPFRLYSDDAGIVVWWRDEKLWCWRFLHMNMRETAGILHCLKMMKAGVAVLHRQALRPSKSLEVGSRYLPGGYVSPRIL